MHIRIPYDKNHRYFTHIEYITKIFQYNKECDVQLIDNYPIDTMVLPITIDGIDVAIDFSDAGDQPLPENTICFQFHNSTGRDHIPLFPPISFTEWDIYYKMLKYRYKNRPTIPAPKTLLYNQRPYGNAIERRKFYYKLLDDNNIPYIKDTYDQSLYWKRCIEDIGVSMHIGGHHEHMMDRAHLQLIGLGIPTISRDIHDMNYFHTNPPPINTFEPNIKSINNSISLALSSEGRDITENLQTWFLDTCTPEAIVNNVRLYL